MKECEQALDMVVGLMCVSLVVVAAKWVQRLVVRCRRQVLEAKRLFEICI